MSTNIDKIRAKAFLINPLEEIISKTTNKKIYIDKINDLLDEIKEIMYDNDITIKDILDYDKTTTIEKNMILKYL